MAKVTIIRPVSQEEPEQKIRVAAYARVSTTFTEQQNSYQVQLEYYSHKFADSETEVLVDLYADEGISGTSSETRTDFQRMMRDCRYGKIDRIYTKSISRFARNARDCLKHIRELKSLGITIYFEKENLDTAKNADEIMLTVMAGLAQEESVSISKNQKWAIRKKMQNGTYQSSLPYGFTRIDGKVEIVESEAEIVRQIFAWYLEGYGSTLIAHMLNDAGISRKNYAWNDNIILKILQNERYIGNTVFQKSYATETVPFTRKKNEGELPMYHVTGVNAPIIPEDDFRNVQELLQKRNILMNRKTVPHEYLFSGRLKCACCGFSYVHKPIKGLEYWVCQKHEKSVKLCPNKGIAQETVRQMFIQLFNKLYFCCDEILVPLLNSVEKVKMRKFSGSQQIIELQKKAVELKEQVHVLTTLRTKGFLSEEKYHEQTAGLNQKILQIQREIRKLMQSADEDETLEQLGMLTDYFRKRESPMLFFEEEAFTFLIDRIVIKSSYEAEFHLPGGLKLTEHCPQKQA